MLFQLVQLFYWLSLSTWFGGVLFVLLATQIVFRTVRENNPILSHVLSVNLDGQHSTLLAGSIMYNLISRLMQVEMICAGMLLISLIGQTLLIDLNGSRLVSAVLRALLFFLAAGVALFDWQVVWPKIQSSRTEYIDHADEPEIANPALDRFDRQQRTSQNLLAMLAALLIGMILFSSGVGTFTVELQKAAK